MSSTFAVDPIACLWIVLLLTNVILADNNFYTQGRYGKRQESRPESNKRPLFFPSRYGRSIPNSDETSGGGSKIVEISPRPDRFYLGSRYGKRGPVGDEESTGGSRFTSLSRLEAILRYLDRARRSNQHRNKQNYEIEQIYYDNGYDDGNDDNLVEDNDSKTPCQSGSQC
ncbi:uncharacterized protein RYa isoform X2 [Fopius arisanus]|nr:PREDICTED: uncharacterized protein LOC105265716 isoform X2 [Fopius arisanus]